jgi:hypothetical protein
MVCSILIDFTLFHFFFSPHHGKGIADSFGGEFRKRIDNCKMKKSAYNFECFFEMCQEEFKCWGKAPGSEKITFLKFSFN